MTYKQMDEEFRKILLAQPMMKWMLVKIFGSMNWVMFSEN